MIKRLITTTTLLALLLVSVTAQADIVLNLSSPDLFGTPGTTVSWDFSLANNTAYDLYVNSVYADGTLYGVPLIDGSGGASALGTFWDAYFSVGGLVVPANSTTLSILGALPLATFEISNSAPAGGPAVTGAIKLDYMLIDPATATQDSIGDTVGSGTLIAQYNGADALASVTVTSAVVPEPSTYALLCISLGVVGFARRKMVKGE